MRVTLIILLIIFSQVNISAQSKIEPPYPLDSLVTWVSHAVHQPIKDSAMLLAKARRAVVQAKEKNNKLLLAISYRNLATWHSGNNSIDSTIWYLQQAEKIYIAANADTLLASTYLEFEDTYKQVADYSAAMTYNFKAISLYEKVKLVSGVATCYTRLCDLMYYQEKYAEGADYCQKAIDIQKELNAPDELAVSYRFKADNLLILDKYDEALQNINLAIDVLKQSGKKEYEIMQAYNTRGNIYKYLKRYDEALAAYKNNYKLAQEQKMENYYVPSLGNIGHVYRLQHNYSAALPYTLEAIAIMKRTGNTQNLWENYMHAADSYEALGDYKNGLKYHRLYMDEELQKKIQVISQLESELQIKYETSKKNETIELQEAKISQQKKNRVFYISIAALLILIIGGMFLSLRNIARKRKALKELNMELEQRRKDVETSNTALEKSLEDLKATQSQLIQAEKMASLGELTAGIAHEIQNPLNFVNNFSEVSNELIDEMNEELNKGDIEEAKAISFDIKQNLEKINHHGKRADAIVKGMLQHSRSSSGIKEPTDINALADEYLRLAYHGLRAKDKSFNATTKTDFDESIGNINIIPQDMGRVILNLITNAFYIVDEKKKQNPTGYEPIVTVRTKAVSLPLGGRGVLLSVTDNGNGIPQKVLDKIFQPFFTTKPTGQGTGLGLSLSYDIVKAHGGKLNVDTKEGEGTTFTVQLNSNN